MLAMAGRTNLSETITDVLIAQGHEEVAHAVVANTMARFSDQGRDRLLEKATADEALRALLQRRVDLPESRLRQLVALADKAPRKRGSCEADVIERRIGRGPRFARSSGSASPQARPTQRRPIASARATRG